MPFLPRFPRLFFSGVVLLALMPNHCSGQPSPLSQLGAKNVAYDLTAPNPPVKPGQNSYQFTYPDENCVNQTASVPIDGTRIITVNVSGIPTSGAPTIKDVGSYMSAPRNWQVLYKNSPIAVTDVRIQYICNTDTGKKDETAVAALLILGTPLPLADKVSKSELHVKSGDFEVPPEPSSSKSSGLQLVSDSKNADIKFSFGTQSAISATPNYTWDIAASFPFSLRAGQTITPSFTSKANQSPNLDPDSSSLRGTYAWTIPTDSVLNGVILSADLIGYEFERKAKQQAILVDGKPQLQSYDKKNANLIWSDSVTFVPRIHQSPKRLLDNTSITLATEYGKSVSRSIVKTTTTTTANYAVLRSVATLDYYWNGFFYCTKVVSPPPSPPQAGDTAPDASTETATSHQATDTPTHSRKKVATQCQASDTAPHIQFDGHYTLRSPFLSEPFKQTYVNGGNEFYTTKPRHYAMLNLVYNPVVGAGISLKYEYGSLPPTFQFLDNQLTTGIQIQLSRK